jgi:hypothetical protein
MGFNSEFKGLILERRLEYPLDERLGGVGKSEENILPLQGI